ncbi:MAG: EAL domain-containing protein [Gammaproteobacteria bacterium]
MDRYARLAADMLPGHSVEIEICDINGQAIWSSAANIDKHVSTHNHMHGRDTDDKMSNLGSQEAIQSHHKTIHCLLGDVAGHSAGEIVFHVSGDLTGADITSEHMSAMFNNVAAVINRELSYLHEANTMAHELGERYDELAMLRSAEQPIADCPESRHMLSRYIRSCADHLKVDYAVIWVPARGAIYPAGLAYKQENTQYLLILEAYCVAGFDMFKSGHKGFGINKDDEELRSLMELPADKKIAIVPVNDFSGTPCGVICCLNESLNRDFTSSDICTLEALSHETFKHLQDTQDELTGLLNRKGFEESIWREVNRATSSLFLVLINLDQFSVINAAYGVSTGDHVLQMAAEKIGHSDNCIKLAARLEADLFALLIDSNSASIKQHVSQICNDINDSSIFSKGKKISIRARAGITAFNTSEATLADNIYAAELAIASANEEAHCRVVVYEPGNDSFLKRKNELAQVENIRQALQQDRFELYCQRIAPLSEDEAHYEILVRMIDDDGQLVPPDNFIPIAERYNLMADVDRWITRRAFQILSSDEYRAVSTQFKWGINLSGMTIGDESFHCYVSECLREYDLLPTNIYFEITETAAIRNYQNCKTFMNEIRAMGVQFALDDFGSGLSSFSYLKKLSVDYLKIDGSLIRDIVSSRLDQTMVTSISKIAKVLGVKTIAEYVENDAIMHMLEGMGIDYVQGYGVMRPQPLIAELAQLGEKSLIRLKSGT